MIGLLAQQGSAGAGLDPATLRDLLAIALVLRWGPPMVLDGPMTGPVFQAYVRQLLVPTLRPGDIVALDNLPAHRVAGVREATEAAGPAACSCHPTVPTSIRSSNCSQGSKRCSARPPPEQKRRSGAPSLTRSTRSLPTNAAPTSEALVTNQTDRRML